MFNALWVLYTFENGGTLGEETLDAGRNAPRAVIGAYLFAITCGFLFLLTLTPSIPDMKAAMLGGVPAENAITAHLPIGVFKLFLVVVSIGLIVATNTMFTGAVRHIYGMATGRAGPVLAHVLAHPQGRLAVDSGAADRRPVARPGVRVHDQDLVDRRRRDRRHVRRPTSWS